MDSWIMWIVGCSVAYWAGFFIGGHLKAFQIMQRLLKDPEGMKDLIDKLKIINDAETQEELDADTIEMEIENVGDLVYAYDKTTGQFLAQAQNIYQVATLAAARYPGKKFWHPSLKQDSQTA